jgi:hypothetical protein
MLWIGNEDSTYCINHPDEVSTYPQGTVSSCCKESGGWGLVFHLFVIQFRRLWTHNRYVLAAVAIHGPWSSPLYNIVPVCRYKRFPPFCRLSFAREDQAGFGRPSRVQMGRLVGC